jgi:Tfp pilus assembly protein PilO
MTHTTWWIKENQPLALFLIAQVVAVISAAAYLLTYMVQLENRVHTLETRGSPHLTVVDNRLTVLEKQTESNLARIDRVTEIMLRELPIKREQPR